MSANKFAPVMSSFAVLETISGNRNKNKTRKERIFRDN